MGPTAGWRGGLERKGLGLKTAWIGCPTVPGLCGRASPARGNEKRLADR
jgi:hypothetical protein